MHTIWNIWPVRSCSKSPQYICMLSIQCVFEWKYLESILRWVVQLMRSQNRSKSVSTASSENNLTSWDSSDKSTDSGIILQLIGPRNYCKIWSIREWFHIWNYSEIISKMQRDKHKSANRYTVQSRSLHSSYLHCNCGEQGKYKYRPEEEARIFMETWEILREWSPGRNSGTPYWTAWYEVSSYYMAVLLFRFLVGLN